MNFKEYREKLLKFCFGIGIKCFFDILLEVVEWVGNIVNFEFVWISLDSINFLCVCNEEKIDVRYFVGWRENDVLLFF